MNQRDKKVFRVLHVGKYFPPHPGGMETYLRDLMNEQSRQGIEVMALVHSSETRLIDQEATYSDREGCTYRVIRCARWMTIGFVPVCPMFLLSTDRAIREFNPDILHIHQPNAAAAWLLLSLKARQVPWISTWQSDVLTPGASFGVKLSYAIYRLFESAVIRRCCKILATSPNYLRSSPPLKRVPVEKLSVLPLGLDTNRIPPLSSVSKMKKPEQLVLYVGRLATYKNLSFLIDALSELDKTHLWVVGSGPKQTVLKQQVEKLGLGPRVTFFHNVSENDIWDFYYTCDVLCLPSSDKTEAFGMVLLEAAYFGKPLVVQDIAGSGVGWVADRLGQPAHSHWDCPQSLAKSLNHALTADRNKIAFGRVPKIFDLRMQVQSLSSIYRSALAESPSED